MATAKQPAASETSKSIEDQVTAYLKKGGEIQQIESGVSGQQSMGERKHINLGNSPTKKPESITDKTPETENDTDKTPETTVEEKS